MAKVSVGEVMTATGSPVVSPPDAAAQAMRDQVIGDVVVTSGPTMVGVVTDRDIVIRAIAENLPPKKTTLGSITAHELIMVEQSATGPGTTG